MLTYKAVQDFVLDKYKTQVHTCYIAHVKELNKMPMRATPVHNRRGKDRVLPCPDSIRPMIEDAFRTNGDL
jgi:hypothetical protein